MCLKQQSAPTDTAAILVEPVLGEGGYVPAPAAFFHGLRKVCDQHGIMLIVDEVQSGFGRTGRYFSIEHNGVRPDILVVAKVRLRSLKSHLLTHHRAWRMGSRSVGLSAEGS